MTRYCKAYKSVLATALCAFAVPFDGLLAATFGADTRLEDLRFSTVDLAADGVTPSLSFFPTPERGSLVSISTNDVVQRRAAAADPFAPLSVEYADSAISFASASSNRSSIEAHFLSTDSPGNSFSRAGVDFVGPDAGVLVSPMTRVIASATINGNSSSSGADWFGGDTRAAVGTVKLVFDDAPLRPEGDPRIYEILIQSVGSQSAYAESRIVSARFDNLTDHPVLVSFEAEVTAGALLRPIGVVPELPTTGLLAGGLAAMALLRRITRSGRGVSPDQRRYDLAWLPNASSVHVVSPGL